MKLLSHERCRESFHGSKSWQIESPCHSLIIHRGGRIRRLQANLHSQSISEKAPLPLEIWSFPAGCSYSSRVWGDSIEYDWIQIEPRAYSALGEASFPTLMGHRDPFLGAIIERWVSAPAPLRAALEQAALYHLQSLPQERINRFKASVDSYVDENLARPIRTADLCRVTRMGQKEFMRRFASEFSTTPAQYVLQQRIRRASSLLAGDLELVQIALECGFSSHSHLTQTFKRWTGLTPTHFRQRPPEVQR